MDAPAAPAPRTYRLFRVNGAGRVVSVPDTIEAPSDAAAVERARAAAAGASVELWDGARLVWRSCGPQAPAPA